MFVVISHNNEPLIFFFKNTEYLLSSLFFGDFCCDFDLSKKIVNCNSIFVYHIRVYKNSIFLNNLFQFLFVFWDVIVRKTLLELLTQKMDHMNCSNSDACTCWDRQSNLFWHGVQLDNQVLNFRYPWLWQTRLNVFRTISTERIVDTTSMDA